MRNMFSLIKDMPDPINIQKIKTILLYFTENTNARYLGKVKLMKLFYFLDFMHVKKYGYPVTFDQYFHLEHGPIPTVIKNLVDEIDNANQSDDQYILEDTIGISKTAEQNIHRIIAKRKLNEEDRKLLSPTELEILTIVANKFSNTKAKEIEDLSHQEYPWKSTSIGDPIPYTLASYDSDSLSTQDDITFLQEILK